jgi:hypothetical protein
MKAILEFNLPEEIAEFWDHANGPKYRDACTELDRFLRGKLKYARLGKQSSQLLQEARNILHECLSDTDWEGA